MLGASSQLMQQIGGCNAVIYYFPLLFENSIGASHDLSLLLGGINMIVYSIFATTSWFIIERTGRRKLFLIGTYGQGLSMVLVFGALIPGTPSAAKGAAVGLFTYIAFFAATWVPVKEDMFETKTDVYMCAAPPPMAIPGRSEPGQNTW
jgi:hypothetical protein